MAKKLSALPGLSKWSTMGGGTAGGGKRGYDLRTSGQTFTISPTTTQYGRFAGYVLSVYPGVPARGHHQIGVFRSPHTAVSAASRWAVQAGVVPGLADNPARTAIPSQFVPARVRRLPGGRIHIELVKRRSR